MKPEEVYKPVRLNMDEVGLTALQTTLAEQVFWGRITNGQYDTIVREAETKVRLLAAGNLVLTITREGDYLPLAVNGVTEDEA